MADQTTTDDRIERARELILSNSRVTLNDVANHLQISHGSVYAILHDRLGFRKVSAGWIPKELTKEHK
jgi:hypothetical protein